MEIDALIALWDAEIIGPINEPRPPYYETEINDDNEVPPYTLPFCDPPEYKESEDFKTKRRLLKKYSVDHYLPGYIESTNNYSMYAPDEYNDISDFAFYEGFNRKYTQRRC